jgi:hypothetical protein
MRNVEYITNGFGASNYTPAGPLGNQFITPYGDPYRVQGVSGIVDSILGSVGNILGTVGKIAAPILPGLAQVGIGSLLNKNPNTGVAGPQQPSQSQFTQVTGQAQVQQAEKSNTAIYVAVGAAALIAAYFLLSKRRR